MKMFGLFALALTVLSCVLWMASWVYWNFYYSLGLVYSNSDKAMLGVSLLAGICAFMALICLAIGLIIGSKKVVNE